MAAKTCLGSVLGDIVDVSIAKPAPINLDILFTVSDRGDLVD